MHPQLESVFDEAENRYLTSEELGILTQYVDSLPDRLATYRTIRDQELDIMQIVANQLEVELSQEQTVTLERSIRNALLVLRYCAMGMLMDDEAFVKERLQGWLTEITKAYNMQTVDLVLYRLLNESLSQTLTSAQNELIQPFLELAREVLLGQETLTAAALGW
jgi:hypothetical protein